MMSVGIYPFLFLWDEMKVHERICYCHNDADLNLKSSFSYVCLSLFSILAMGWSGATRAKREKLGDPSAHSIIIRSHCAFGDSCFAENWPT